jgi:NADP-dependent 3-hydroxy acid dehydrogenase YdfG
MDQSVVVRPFAIVVGAGPGVSGSFARRLTTDGWDVGLLGADDAVLADLGDELRGSGASVLTENADITKVSAATTALTRMASQAGRVDLLHFNPSAYRERDPLTLSVDELLQDVAVGVGGLLVAIQAVRGFMSAGARVTATGSMAADEPNPAAASLGVQKAGLRNVVHSLDAALAPHGIRAVSLTVRGALSREGAFTPDRVADALLAAMRQDEGAWRTEVPYSG